MLAVGLLASANRACRAYAASRSEQNRGTCRFSRCLHLETEEPSIYEYDPESNRFELKSLLDERKILDDDFHGDDNLG